jgi:hypothetical protein
MDGVAEAASDLFGGNLLHAQSAQDLIAPVQALLGFEEESLQVVHDQ